MATGEWLGDVLGPGMRHGSKLLRPCPTFPPNSSHLCGRFRACSHQVRGSFFWCPESCAINSQSNTERPGMSHTPGRPPASVSEGRESEDKCTRLPRPAGQFLRGSPTAAHSSDSSLTCSSSAPPFFPLPSALLPHTAWNVECLTNKPPAPSPHCGGIPSKDESDGKCAHPAVCNGK